jgi:formate--tetrahydrofolate ligase
MKSDIEIAQSAKLLPIREVAEKIGIEETELEPYGKYKGKLSLDLLKRLEGRRPGRLIMVTAITPTAFGEGKTTVSVGLGMGLCKLGKKAIVALREPSLGPCFGIKGGAAGGGYVQVLPMEEINLHFTGDIHAVSTAHNLLSAMLDNHLHQGNALGIDPREVVWPRAMDMNERALRRIVVGLGGRANGVPREDGFIISVASEVMAILGLARDLSDLKERVGRIVVGYTRQRKAVCASDLKVDGAMAALLKDALKPNLVQTLDNTPALIHCGPFANIAHGTNSLLSTQLALKLSQYTITESGFGSDLGGEKFLNIVARAGGFDVDLVVIVASVRALKLHGGAPEKELMEKGSVTHLRDGLPNLEKHVENMRKFGVPVVVAINRFSSDTDEEIGVVASFCAEKGVESAVYEGHSKGARGAVDLAQKVVDVASSEKSEYHPLYDLELPLKEKIEVVAREIYGADGVDYTPRARRRLRTIESLGFGNLPVCVAKTPRSLSDNARLYGVPRGFRITIQDVRLSAGAGFVVPLAGDIMLMPGLPKAPAAESIDVDSTGQISGLF